MYEIRITFIDTTRELLDKALEYSIENNVTVYDMYYIVSSFKLNIVVYMADEKLLRRLKEVKPK